MAALMVSSLAEMMACQKVAPTAASMVASMVRMRADSTDARTAVYLVSSMAVPTANVKVSLLAAMTAQSYLVVMTMARNWKERKKESTWELTSLALKMVLKLGESCLAPMTRDYCYSGLMTALNYWGMLMDCCY